MYEGKIILLRTCQIFLGWLQFTETMIGPLGTKGLERYADDGKTFEKTRQYIQKRILSFDALAGRKQTAERENVLKEARIKLIRWWPSQKIFIHALQLQQFSMRSKKQPDHVEDHCFFG